MAVKVLPCHICKRKKLSKPCQRCKGQGFITIETLKKETWLDKVKSVMNLPNLNF